MFEYHVIHVNSTHIRVSTVPCLLASVSQMVVLFIMASNTGIENIQAIFASMPAQCQAVYEDQMRNSVRPTRAKSGI